MRFRNVAIVTLGLFAPMLFAQPLLAESAAEFRNAAEQGNAEAQSNLGFCYQKGKGVTESIIEAVRWYRKSAEQGYAKGQYNLGCCYAFGLGVEKDQAQSVKWFRKAAEQGYKEAQYNLGWCYKNGNGVEVDKVEGLKWYLKAAEQGHVDAQFNLGAGYYNGDGVAKDDVEAAKWLRKAAEQGHEGAKEELRLMGMTATPVATKVQNTETTQPESVVQTQTDEPSNIINISCSLVTQYNTDVIPLVDFYIFDYEEELFKAFNDYKSACHTIANTRFNNYSSASAYTGKINDAKWEKICAFKVILKKAQEKLLCAGDFRTGKFTITHVKAGRYLIWVDAKYGSQEIYWMELCEKYERTPLNMTFTNDGREMIKSE